MVSKILMIRGIDIKARATRSVTIGLNLEIVNGEIKALSSIRQHNIHVLFIIYETIIGKMGNWVIKASIIKC